MNAIEYLSEESTLDLTGSRIYSDPMNPHAYKVTLPSEPEYDFAVVYLNDPFIGNDFEVSLI